MLKYLFNLSKLEALPTCQEEKPIQEQSIESQPLSHNIEEVELFTNSLEITKTSTNVIDDSFKKKIYMLICTYKQSYNYLQKITNFPFFPKNRKILSEINLQKLENFNNPYNDKIKNLDKIDFTKFSAMMTLLCVRLAKDVHTSRSVSIFSWVQNSKIKFSKNKNSVYFIPDKTTLNCKWNIFNSENDNFKIKLKTCKGSILKKTNFMITIPKLYKFIKIQVNPFEINPVIIFNDKNGKDIVFEVTHRGFTPVSKKIIQYDYIHPTLFVRAIISSGKIHKRCGRNMMYDSKISLFDKDSKNFITYYLDDGRVSYEYYCNYERYKKRKYITEKSESCENCSFGMMHFSITEPVFAVTINNGDILFINYETHQVVIQNVGKNVIFHPRLPLFWTPASIEYYPQKKILSRLWLINTSFTQAIPIAYGVNDPIGHFDAM
jgi:hypothetical protein